MTKLIITQAGLDKLKEELKYLKEVKRKEIRERIKLAKEYGDLSENSEYSDAKDQQSFTEGRIQELEEQIRNAQIVSNKKDLSKVDIGDTVTISSVEGEETYQIVGATESDPLNGKISSESPIAKALLGHKTGDEVSFPTPDGDLKCKILKIA